MRRPFRRPEDDGEGAILYDEGARSVQLGTAEPTVLRVKSFGAFVALAEAHPQTVSKDRLIEEVWGRTAVSDDSVVQCIADIRRALGDAEHRIVQTIPGEGYRLTHPARRLGAPVAEESAAGSGMSRPVIFLAAAALVAVGVLGAWLWTSREDGAPEAVAGTPALAVGTFENLAGDDRWDRLARGLTHEIVIDLTRLDTLPVLSPTLVGEDTAPDALISAYADLGARYVVSGTIQADSGTLRIASHLTDTETGEIVWVRRWEQPEEDFFAIQDEIVNGVANELANRWSGKIAGIGAELAKSTPSSSLAAYDHAQLGVAAFRVFDGAALRMAERHLRDALSIDPYYAEAWASLAFVLGARTALAPAEELPALQEARANAGRQAYHLGEGSAATLLAGSWTAVFRGNRSEAVRRLSAAVAGAPNDTDILAMASMQGALTTGMHEDALAWGTEALRLNADPPAWYHIGPGLALFFLGDAEGAAGHLVEAPQGHPLVLAYLSAAEARRDETARAAAAAARLGMLHPGFTAARYLEAETLYPGEKREALAAAMAEAGIPAE